MSQAFISYHRAQRKLARLIAHRIAADGHSVWWDRGERPGDSWSEAVSTALANAACVVVIWSKQAAASPWVLGEATAGYGKGALVSVCADRTLPPSPFDKAPVIDMQEWDGAGADVAWIRLRDPLRAKLETAERSAAADAPLPPPRAQAPPVRVGFSSAAIEPPPPYVEEKRRSGGAGGFLTLLALGGVAAAGWTWREPIRTEFLALRDAWPPSAQDAQTAASLAPIEPVAMTAPAAAPLLAPVSEPVPAVAEDLPPVIEAATPAPAAAVIASAPRMTYDWRDAYVPPPTLRSLPAVDERKAAPPSPAPAPAARAAFTDMPPLPPPASPRRVELHQGRFIELDIAAAERKTDLWFAPDRTGYGLFLGVANGSRMRLVDGRRANAQGCKDAVLRRNPVAARDLDAGVGLCVRSSAGVTSAWRIEGVETRDSGAIVRLVAATP